MSLKVTAKGLTCKESYNKGLTFPCIFPLVQNSVQQLKLAAIMTHSKLSRLCDVAQINAYAYLHVIDAIG